MKLEIERKFLIHPDRMPRLVRGQKITQGYLSVDPAVRVRIRGVKSFVTIKFGNAFKREEYEWIISKSDSTALLKKCKFKIEKTRFKFHLNGDFWEIDVFEGENKGLVVAEIELKTEKQIIQKPLWLDREVTNEVRYLNVNLAQKPYNNW